MSSIRRQYRDVPYAGLSAAQKMDIFVPEGTGPFPAVVLIHGGAFRMGDKSMNYEEARTLVAHGFAAVTINYRLSGEAKFPAAVQDCKAALRYLRAHAATYSIAPDRIGSWGASAGGNLSAMLGVSGGEAYFEDAALGNSGVSSRVQAAVNWFGPIDFGSMVAEGRALGFPADYSVENESQYLGADVQDPAHAQLVAKANPASYIDPSDPPFFIQAGSRDPLIPYTQSQYFAEKLKAVLDESQVFYELLEGEGHGGPQFDSEANLSRVIQFFDKHLK